VLDALLFALVLSRCAVLYEGPAVAASTTGPQLHEQSRRDDTNRTFRELLAVQRGGSMVEYIFGVSRHRRSGKCTVDAAA